MTNLSHETNAHIREVGVPFKAILIKEEHYTIDNPQEFYLPPSSTESEIAKFFGDTINTGYNSGFGTQYYSGIIWFEDGSWSDRREYDGSEWWEHHSCPPLPEKRIA